MTPNFDISGRTAAITGAGGILLSELSRQFAELHVKVALLDINEDAARAVADSINQSGGQAIAVKCNVLDKASVEAALSAVEDRLGPVDILINGAGGNNARATASDTLSFFDIPEDALKFVFDLNFVGTLIPTQIFGKRMMERGKGSIVNFCSMSGIRPLTNVVGYSAAKAAVANFTMWAAGYFAKHGAPGVRVNAIAPGFFLTEQNRFLLTDKETGADTPRGGHIKQQTPMGRYGDPAELVGAVVYLCSDASSFVDGVVLPIDGGFAAFSI